MRDDTLSLRLQGVTKRFGEVEVLTGIDVDVRDGEFLTLLGPSGSGKTTLLRIIVGFEGPSGGAVLLHGRDVSALSPAERDIGMVFQQYALFPHMTVAQNVEYGLKLRRWPADKRRERVQEMLRAVRLDGKEGRYPRELSGGQQQRVAFARALAFGPKLLLMDEPLGALDRSLRLEMEEEIRRVHRELKPTIVYVTHDQQEALALSDRIAIMDRGRIAALDTPQRLYYHPNSAFVARFFANANVLPVELGDARAVRDAADGRVAVRLHGQSLDVAPGAGVGPRDGAAVSVRPRSFSLGARADGERGLRVRGRVAETLLLGEDREVTVSLPDGGRIQALLDARTAHGVDVGADVDLFAPADELVLVAA